MKRKKWLYATAVIAFYISCAQTLAKMQKAEESLDDERRDSAEIRFGYDETCAIEKDDPFEIRVRLNKPGNPCLDSKSRRPLVDLTQDEEWASRLGSPGKGVKRVANFKHDDTFYIADIPLHSVQNAEFQLSWFEAPANVPAAHAQMLINFGKETPVKLYEQKTHSFEHTNKDKAKHKKAFVYLPSMILSAEGSGEEGKTCELIGGQQGKYALVYGLGSAYQRYSEVLRFNPKREIDSLSLQQTNQKDLIDYVELYLSASFENFENLEARVDTADFSIISDDKVRDQATELSRSAKFEKATYRTLSRNCSTALIDILKQGNVSQNRNYLVRVLGNLSFYPPAAAFFLRSVNMLKLKDKKKLDLEAELLTHRALSSASFDSEP